MPSTKRPRHSPAKRSRLPWQRARIARKAKRSASSRKGRAVLRRRVGARSNVYSFSRSRTDLILPWRNSLAFHNDEGARFFLNKADVNGDQGYYIMQTKLALRDLPSYDEFRTLFTRYKLTGWDTRITPTDLLPEHGQFLRPWRSQCGSQCYSEPRIFHWHY